MAAHAGSLKLHASVILSEDVLDYAPLFVEIADAYYERELYADAKPIYELLGSDANVRFLSQRYVVKANVSQLTDQQCIHLDANSCVFEDA